MKSNIVNYSPMVIVRIVEMAAPHGYRERILELDARAYLSGNEVGKFTCPIDQVEDLRDDVAAITARATDAMVATFRTLREPSYDANTIARVSENMLASADADAIRNGLVSPSAIVVPSRTEHEPRCNECGSETHSYCARD